MKNSNKVALITGSSTGVGAATCIKLAKLGWNVVVNYSKSEKEANQTAAACEQLGAEVLVCQANVANDEACKGMVAKTMEKWGRLDALVNNAGKTKFCPYDNLDGLNKADFLDIYEVNLVGAYQMSRAAAPFLKNADDGVIVNTSSTSAISGLGSSIAYASSKGALTTMTLSLAHALAPKIRVNAVCPGFIEGSWLKGLLGEQFDTVKESFEKKALVNRVCLPEDVADSIVYLIAHARMLTGEIITIDGGNLANRQMLR